MLLRDNLDDVTEEFSEFLVVLHLVVEDGRSDVIHDFTSVFVKVGSHDTHVLDWVADELHGSLNWGEVELRFDDVFANWKSLLELLVSTDNSHDSSDSITDGILGSGVMKSFLEGLVSDIKEKKGLVLLVDAKKKVQDVEVTSESLKETGVHLSQFHFLLLLLALRSEENVGSSLSAILTEVIPFIRLVVSDSRLDLMGDLDTIVDDVTSNVPGEGNWALEGLSDFGKLSPVSLEGAAVLHAVSNLVDGISNILDTSDLVAKMFLLEVLEGILSILDDCLTITDALLDVSESLSIDGSHEETLNH